jgi:hypothetical protein
MPKKVFDILPPKKEERILITKKEIPTLKEKPGPKIHFPKISFPKISLKRIIFYFLILLSFSALVFSFNSQEQRLKFGQKSKKLILLR